jgi:hypothetical protein
MRTDTIARFAAILPSLATFCTGSFKTLRKANRIRIYRPEAVVEWSPEVNAAIKTLLESGHVVKVYEKAFVYCPVLVADTVVWERKDARVDRSAGEGRFDAAYSCVEVSL